MTDSSLPTFRCALVENVVNDENLWLVFEEASEDAIVVASHMYEALVLVERPRVVSERDYEHATGSQFNGSSFDEALDGGAGQADE